ncbi:MAG: response regulator [Myxococcales bacterium]|nr:MAG: response regulator [Myxococcales bacterium]
MSSSSVVCKDCGDSSAAVEWGFVLLARHGWTAQLGETGGEPEWRCPPCNERLAASGVWDLGADAEPTRRRLRLLLVDDQVLVLRATAGMLRELDVVTAGSAAEALAKLADGSHFDVIVSDVAMPHLSGAELYVRVRERYPQLAERFLLLSGDSYGASLLCSSIARRENLPSMPKILDKPVPRDVLLREVESVGHRRLPRSGTFSIGEVESHALSASSKTK